MNHSSKNEIFNVFLKIVLIVCIFGFSFFFIFNNSISTKATAQTNRLAYFSKIYPVEVVDEELRINLERFNEAILFLYHHQDYLSACIDLIYLGDHNNIELTLSPFYLEKFLAIKKNIRAEYISYNSQINSRLQSYKYVFAKLNDSIGMQHIEIVLNDVRDPMHSIIDIHHTIFERTIEGPIGTLGFKLIQLFSDPNNEQKEYLNYSTVTSDGRKIKSSIIPLRDDELGLFGLLCIHVDLEKVQSAQLDDLLHTITKVKPNSQIRQNFHK